MCSACIATALLIVAGATAVGGLTALAIKTLRAKTGARDPDPTTQRLELDAQADGDVVSAQKRRDLRSGRSYRRYGGACQRPQGGGGVPAMDGRTS